MHFLTVTLPHEFQVLWVCVSASLLLLGAQTYNEPVEYLPSPTCHVKFSRFKIIANWLQAGTLTSALPSSPEMLDDNVTEDYLKDFIRTKILVVNGESVEFKEWYMRAKARLTALVSKEDRETVPVDGGSASSSSAGASVRVATPTPPTKRKR